MSRKAVAAANPAPCLFISTSSLGTGRPRVPRTNLNEAAAVNSNHHGALLVVRPGVQMFTAQVQQLAANSMRRGNLVNLTANRIIATSGTCEEHGHSEEWPRAGRARRLEDDTHCPSPYHHKKERVRLREGE